MIQPNVLKEAVRQMKLAQAVERDGFGRWLTDEEQLILIDKYFGWPVVRKT